MGKTSLTSIILPDGLTSIGYSAFSGCSGLTSITIFDGVTSIGSDAFYNCSGLTSITIPDGVTSIGSYVFYNCRGLTSITIPDGVTSIGNSAFYNCSGLTSIKIPDGVTSIGNSTFSGCSGLTSIKIPNGVTSIGNSTFSGCSGLTSITIPDGVTSIESDAFYNCSGLTSINIPDRITYIGNGAFTYCSSLTSIDIPSGVTSIGRGAFANCSNLTSITLPAKLASIENYAFYYCSGLTSIINLNPIPVYIYDEVFYDVNKSNCELKVPTSSVTAYQEANVWKDFYNITGGGLSFNVNVNISTLGSITAPASGLYPANTNITLTATPVSSSNFIGWTTGNGDPISNEPTLNFLLTDNTVITAVFGNTGNYPITAGTLKDIAGIETVTHLTLTGEIDARDVKFMRDDMPYLTELDLSGATIVAYEGKDGTYPWEYPSSFLYPANEMPNLAFYNGYQGKTSLTSIILPNGLNSIGSGAFTYCSGLTSINIPAGVDSIKDAALYSAGLTSINIPVGVTFIGEFVFGGCHRLTSIILPDGLTSIEDYAFAYCNNLTTITNLNPVPQSINSNVFEGVDKSACELHVSSSLYNAYSTADVWKEFHVVSVNMYTVNTNSDNGSATGSGIYEANTSVTVIATPSSGYQFKDWTSNQTTVSSKNPYTFTVTQDIDLTANFEAIAYNIRYELDGGVNHPENPSTYTINDSISLKAPSRDDYLFVGWSNDGIIAKGATGEQTFTASWQHNNIVITINGEEVDISNSANDSVFEYTVKECDESSIQLDLGALPNTTITVDGVEQQGSEITLQGDITTVNINIESIDKDYTLKISSPITGDLYHRRWDDVIAINRNHETNGGHNVSDIQWYHKDGTSAGGGDYLELSNNKTLDDYYSNVKTVETDAWHRVCATETKSTAQIIAYPNPVPRGGKVTVQLPESFVGSVLKVYDIKGSLVKSDISLPVTINNIDVSEHTPGIYLLQVSDRNGNRQTVKIIIE